MYNTRFKFDGVKSLYFVRILVYVFCFALLSSCRFVNMEPENQWTSVFLSKLSRARVYFHVMNILFATWMYSKLNKNIGTAQEHCLSLGHWDLKDCSDWEVLLLRGVSTRVC